VGGQFGEQAGLPHVRVAGRGEAVQEPGVHVGGALAPQGFRVAEHQRQGDVVRQLQPVVTGAGGRVLVEQRPGGLAQLRPVGQGAGQVVALQRVLFHGPQLQAGAGRRQRQKALGGQQHVEAGAEAGFADHEAVAVGESGEAPVQLVAVEEHVKAFRAAVLAREVGVVEVGGHRGVVLPLQTGRGDWREIGLGGAGRSVGHGWAGSSHYAAWRAANDFSGRGILPC
jgi:hypothetical protein